MLVVIIIIIIVRPEMARFDEGGFDVESVGFVKHAFDQAFDGVFGGAVGTQAGHSEGTAHAAEDEVSASQC